MCGWFRAGEKGARDARVVESADCSRAHLRPAAVHDDDAHADALEQDDVAREERGGVLVRHRVAAVLDDDRLARVLRQEDKNTTKTRTRPARAFSGRW